MKEHDRVGQETQSVGSLEGGDMAGRPLLDPLTAGLIELVQQKWREKQGVSFELRNSLLFDLHFRHHQPVESLAEAFSLSKCYTKWLVKNQATLCRQHSKISSPSDDRQRMKDVMTDIDSEHGTVTAIDIQEKARAERGLEIPVSTLKRWMHQKLRLQWKRVCRRYVYDNSRVNVSLR